MNAASQNGVYISCVSAEFRTTRQRIVNDLTQHGFKVVCQEIRGNEGVDLRKVLRDKIDGCQALIQIVGHSYGAEPKNPDTEFGRVSYTQFEQLYASEKGKKIWIIIAGDGCRKDMSIDRLNHPADVGQNQLDALQDQYRVSCQAKKQLCYLAKTDADIDAVVARMVQDRGIRKPRKAGRNRSMMIAVGIAASIATVSGAGYLIYRHRDVESALLTETKVRTIQASLKSKIQEQLQAAANRTFANAQIADGRADGKLEREKLKGLAARENVRRQALITELADSFADLERSPSASYLMKEMISILKTEGVESAVAYSVTKQQAILDAVKTRGHSAVQINRRDLLVVVRTAQLQALITQFDSATAMLDDVLISDAEFPEALAAKLQLFLERGERATSRESTGAAMLHFQYAEAAATQLIALQPKVAQWQKDLLACQNGLNGIRKSQDELTTGMAQPPEFAVRHEPTAQELPNIIAKLTEKAEEKKENGDIAGAIDLLQQALVSRRRLAAISPRSIELQRDLSNALSDLATLQSGVGDQLASLDYYRKALETDRKLADAHPDDANLQHGIWLLLVRLGNVKKIQGDLPGSLIYFTQALDLSRKILAGEPDSIERQRTVAASLESIGEIKKFGNDLAGASEAAREVLLIRQRVLTGDSANPQKLQELAQSQSNLGDIRRIRSDLDGAMKSYQQAMQIFRQLLTSEPSNIANRRSLSIVFDRMGEIEKLQGNTGKAFEWYQQSVLLAQELSRKNPDNADLQHDYLIILNKFALLKKTTGDISGALTLYLQSLEISQKLFSNSPQNTQIQHDHITTKGNVAELKSLQGDLVTALDLYKDCLDVALALAANPKNPFGRRDIWVVYNRLAEISTKLKKNDDATAYLTKAFDYLMELKKQGSRITDDEEKYLTYLNNKLGK